MIQSIDRRCFVSALPAALAFAATAGSEASAAIAPAEAVASLAPSGRLRAGINLGNIVLAQKNSQTGEVSGLIVEIARELAWRLGIPLDMVYYDTGGKIAPAQAVDRWDIAFLGNAQAPEFDFSPPYIYVDATYLVRQDAPFRGVADLDRKGVRISTALNSAYDQVLTRTLKNASIVRAPTSAAAIEMFITERLDAAGGVRQALDDAQRSKPGLLVLPDSFTRVDQAVAVPRGREAGLRYLSRYIESIKAGGLVRDALRNSGQSALISPPQAVA